MEPVRLTRRRRLAVLGILAVAAVVVGAFVGGQQPSRAVAQQPVTTDAAPAAAAPAQEPAAEAVKAVPQQGPSAAAEKPSGPPAPVRNGFLTARIAPGTSVVLRAKPDGQRIVTLDARTEFGSPRVLSVVERRGDWLGVHVPELPNGTLGWLDGSATPLRFRWTTLSVRVDLSERRLVVRDGGKVVREAVIAVGSSATPTPTGRFAVTDMLDGAPWAGVYGCCIVALTATQPQLASWWQGGNRIAIHGTPQPELVGQPVSNGCLRAYEEDIRFLFERLPLGTPVTIVA